MFAFQHSGIAPDLITVAKSLAGGFRRGVAAPRSWMRQPGSGGTYGGNAIACAAAPVLDAFEQEDLVERGARLSEQLRAGLLALQQIRRDR